MKKIMALSACFLSGCSTGIISANHDSYFVSVKSAPIHNWFDTAAQEKARAYAEANAYCNGLGGDVDTVSIDTHESNFGRSAQASLQFRCLKKS